MEFQNKKEEIINTLSNLSYFFNTAKGPKKRTCIQYIFNEKENKIYYYFEIENRKCILKEGKCEKPYFTIITDVETFNNIANGYLSGKEEMKKGNFIIKGGILKFLIKNKKWFSGNVDWEIPNNRFVGIETADKIKNVLILSCSPRTINGATHLFVEKLVAGMKKAKANIEILFPAKMKINPCKGCFSCWLKDGMDCVYNDDMKIFWEKYNKSDLLVWATPIYFYHCTTAMKTVMDRLFVRSDPRIILFDGKESHPRKNKHLASQLLIATSGFMDRDVFNPLITTLNEHTKRVGIQTIDHIIRPSVMPFLSEDYQHIKKEKILDAFEKAGEEIIKYSKINKKTKALMEADLFSLPEFLSGSYLTVKKSFENKEVLKRKF